MIFDENNPDVIDISENEYCNKKLIQNDAGPSQNKSYDKHKIYSLDECVENIIKKLRAAPKHLNIDKKKRWTFNLTQKKFPIKQLIQKTKRYKKTNATTCAYATKKTFGIQKIYIIDLGMWKKCDHCKKHHELYLNYNSENNFSSWVDMMDFFLKWNK